MPKTNDNSIVTKGILRYFYEKLSNNLNTLLGKKVDKVYGKGLSTNDFTTAYKNKLDGIANGANKYVLPTASSNVLGGIKTGYQANGKVYALQVDGNGNGYVSVPWTDNNTTYGLATTSANGLLKMLDGNTSHFMRGDGTWATPAGTTYGVVSTTANGLAPMLPTENADKKFLNGEGEWAEVKESINGNTVTGSTFSGETSDCGVQILEVQGKTVQQTTNGYQLFDASKLSTKSQYGATVTNNGDGSFTVSGSGSMSGDMNTNLIDVTDEVLSQLKVGKIYANFGAQTYPYCVFKLSTSPSDMIIRLSSFNSMSDEAEITEDILSRTTKVFLQFYGASGQNIVPGTVKPMVYQDGDGTWEPYTGGKPAPNPDYPMEIENVEISEIYSTNDYNTDNNMELIGKYLNSQGMEVSEDGWDISKYISVPLGITKFTAVRITGVAPSICFYDASKKFISGEAYNNRRDFDISIPTNAKFFRFSSFTKRRKNEHLFIGAYGYETVETSLTLAEGDTYENGQVTRVRKRITFDGSSDESWVMLSATSENQIIVFVCNNPGIEIENYSTDYFCNISEPNSTNAEGNAEGTYVFDNKLRIALDREKASSVEELRTWLSTHPLTVEYELETPTTEEFKVPTIPSYEPYTEISTNSVVDPTITFRPLPYTSCLVGEATEEESGYMPPLSGNSNEFLNGNGEWSVPSGYTLPQASTTTLGGVKIGSNITVSSGTISLTKANVVSALGYTPPTTNTTYSLATTSASGLLRQLSGNTSQFLNGNGQWATPPNTTYGVATTSTNGLMSATDKSRLDQLWAKFDSMVFFTND